MRPTTAKTRAEFVVGTTDIVARALSPLPQRTTVEPMDNTYVETEIKRVASSYDVAPPAIYVWDIDVANGFVLGTPDKTVIVVSSALVDLLSADELVAVLAHELAHTAEHHTLKLSSLLLAAVVVGLAAGKAANRRWCNMAAIATLATVYGLEAVLLLWITRRAEAEADSMAVAATDPEALNSALQKIITAGREAYPERGPIDKVIATHPSYRKRAERGDG